MKTDGVSFEELRERVAAVRMARLPELLSRAQLDAGALATLQRDRLRALLAHATRHSPFHARRLRGLDTGSFELADLSRLPVLTKPELMRDLDDVFTDRRLSRRLAEEALAATTATAVPLLGRYLAQATGGSSGQRGVFVSDVDAYVEVSTAPLRRHLVQLSAGNAIAGGMRIALVAAATAVHSTGLAAALSTPGGLATLHAVPATLPIPEIVARLNALEPHEILGYATLLARLAIERAAGRLRAAPARVVSTSETLTPALRAGIRRGFGVPVVDVFGTTEGLMGATEPDDPVFAFNSDTCIVELVDADDRPVPPGTPSDHVLVTNLCNLVQPLIRYRLDDRFTRRADAPDHGHLRATVEGRADEVLRYPGAEVHPLAVRAVLLKHPEVIDYQVRQTPRGVEVSALVAGVLDTSRLGAELRAALAAAGLSDPTAAVTAVDRLDRHPESGKLRRFVPLAQ